MALPGTAPATCPTPTTSRRCARPRSRRGARRHRRARQGRRPRGAPALAAARGAGALSLRVWQSVPARPGRRASRARHPVGLREPAVRLGYVKAFMDGTLGSGTAWMLDGSGVQITSGEELAEIVRRAPRPVCRWPCTRSATARTERRSTRSRQTRADLGAAGAAPRIEHAQLLAPEDLPRFAELGVAASVQFSHAPSDRGLADRSWGGRPAARTPTGRSSTRARSSPTARTRRSRSSTRSPASAAAVDGASGIPRRR